MNLKLLKQVVITLIWIVAHPTHWDVAGLEAAWGPCPRWPTPTPPCSGWWQRRSIPTPVETPGARAMIRSVCSTRPRRRCRWWPWAGRLCPIMTCSPLWTILHSVYVLVDMLSLHWRTYLGASGNLCGSWWLGSVFWRSFWWLWLWSEYCCQPCRAPSWLWDWSDWWGLLAHQELLGRYVGWHHDGWRGLH